MLNRNAATPATVAAATVAAATAAVVTVAPPPSVHTAMGEVEGGQSLLDAMSSKFNSGLAVGRESEVIRNAAVRKVIECARYF